MNKELILKYKPEFDHWLNGGNILYKHKNSLVWWTDDCWRYSLDYVQAIIINDNYTELRKALVEGEEVEYSITDLNGKHFKWVNILDQVNSYNIDTKVFNYELSAYRLKPEESQFKVGDWAGQGNYTTKKQSQAYAEYAKAEETLKAEIARLNEGWWPDWNDRDTTKYVVALDTEFGSLKRYLYHYTKFSPSFMYLKSGELAEQLIKTHSKELKTYLTY